MNLLFAVEQVKRFLVCVVIGLGGLGLNAVSIGIMFGAKVYGVDLKKGSCDAAAKLGRRSHDYG